VSILHTAEPPGSGSTTPQLGDEIGHLLKVMERTSAQMSARRRDGVDKAAFAVLFRLLSDGPQRSGALAEGLLADPSTISRQVAQLVSLGYVERRADPDDGRATVLAATDAGRDCAHRIRERRNATIARVVADWTPQERSALATLLARFTHDLERHRPQILADVGQVSTHEGEA